MYPQRQRGSTLIAPIGGLVSSYVKFLYWKFFGRQWNIRRVLDDADWTVWGWETGKDMHTTRSSGTKNFHAYSVGNFGRQERTMYKFSIFTCHLSIDTAMQGVNLLNILLNKLWKVVFVNQTTLVGNLDKGLYSLEKEDEEAKSSQEMACELLVVVLGHAQLGRDNYLLCCFFLLLNACSMNSVTVNSLIKTKVLSF